MSTGPIVGLDVYLSIWSMVVEELAPQTALRPYDSSCSGIRLFGRVTLVFWRLRNCRRKVCAKMIKIECAAHGAFLISLRATKTKSRNMIRIT